MRKKLTYQPELKFNSHIVNFAPFLPIRIFTGKVIPFSFRYWRSFAIALIRIYPSYRLGIHRKILIDIPREVLSSGSLKSIKIEAGGNEILPFVTRELALDGFIPSFLDLNLDYELNKNWEFKPVILALTDIQGDVEKKISDYIDRLTDSRSMYSVDDLIPLGEFDFKTIQNCTVIHGQMITDSQNYFPTDSMKLPPNRNIVKLPSINWIGDQDRVIFPKPSTSLEPMREAIFVGGTNNWMHFVIEDLPRLMMLRDSNIDPDVPVLLREDLSTQIKEAVGALTGRKIIYLNIFSAVEVSTLHYFYLNNALPAAMRGDQTNGIKLFNPQLVRGAAQIFSSPNSSKAIKKDRVLIARERNLFRPMSNFNKLRFSLERDFGFRTYFLGGMSFQEIAEAFKTAEIVVAEYGAGLANIIFTSPAAKVIELRGPSESTAIEYEVLVKALGHEHFRVVGSSRFVSLRGIGNGQFSVNVGLLRKVLGGILEKS